MDNSTTPLEPTQKDLAFVAQSYAMRQIYWPDYTWGIQTKYLKIIDAKKDELIKQGVDTDTLRKRLADLFNKINGSFYHLKKLEENEAAIVELGKEMAKKTQSHTPKGVLGIIGTPYEPIDYEYEALLITIKSALDITAIILAPLCDLASDNILQLLNEARQVKQPNDFLAKVLAFVSAQERVRIIDEFRNKEDGSKSKRNYAVHQGSLPTGTINIQFTAASTEIGVLKTRTMEVGGEMATIQNQQNLDTYCTDLFYASCDFMMDALELLLNESLPRGQKLSVYERRQT